MIPRIAIIVLMLALGACKSLFEPPVNAGAAGSNGAPANAAPGTAQPPPAPAATRHFELGGAASALVTQAHARVAAGDYLAATTTLERAQRIEPDNPLVWIELGRVQLAASNPAQADAMGHKAVSLAAGDPAAQSAAWRLIADSLRARRREPEAAAADARAEALVPH
jgi:Flp pilus assembly protein TadD